MSTQQLRIVIKLGSSIIVDDTSRIANDRLEKLVEITHQFKKQGHELIIVSSGAIALGRSITTSSLKLHGDIHDKQAQAAIGQSRLMSVYQDLFQVHGDTIAQILVTSDDLAHRDKYLKLRSTMERLLEWGIIPIVNENDSISTVELNSTPGQGGFGDNDKLSALIAAKLDADALILLTNVDGIYTKNPLQTKDAKKISTITSIEQLKTIETSGKSEFGRGGMSTKIESVRVAAMSGTSTIITSGLDPQCLTSALKHLTEGTELIGTLIKPFVKLSQRKKWIGFSQRSLGQIIINEGARVALEQKNASLLAAGVVAVKGEFIQGQVISICDEQENEIGRGLTYFSANQINQIKGLKSTAIHSVLGEQNHEAIVHKDNLVLLNTYNATGD